MHVFLNGSFLPAEDANVSVFDHGFLYGDGIYETLRTVEGSVFDVHHHYKRFQNSAKILKIHIPYSLKEMVAINTALLAKNGFSPKNDARIRWTLTRGTNNFQFSGSVNPTFLITHSKLPAYPKRYYKNGVRVSVIHLTRILPEVKSTALLPMILGKQKSEIENTYECLFTENNFITEGTVSNFFILDQKNYTIFMPPRQKVLAGTAAKIFRKKSEKLGYSVRERDFTIGDVTASSEAFLTNSLFGVLPVTSINGKTVGTGRVGNLFSTLHLTFWQT